MHRELPSLFRSRIEEVVRREMQPVEASLLGSLDLIGLLRECQEQLSRAYPEANMGETQMNTSPMEPTENLVGLANQQNMAHALCNTTVEQDQHPPSDFFGAVLQPPPPQDQDYFDLRFSSLDEELFGFFTQTSSKSFSESGYASGLLCNCKEPCTCLGGMGGDGS